jgi:hypothetical protein
MSRLSEIESAAKAATPTWKQAVSGELIAPYAKGGWVSVLCCSEEDCGEAAMANLNPDDLAFIAKLTATEVLALCQLIRQQHEALKAMVGYDRERGCGLKIADEALDAGRKWSE